MHSGCANGRGSGSSGALGSSRSANSMPFGSARSSGTPTRYGITTIARLPELRAIVVIPYRVGVPELRALPNGMLFADLLDPSAPLEPEPLPFAHPLCILYSSGTTGVPKCIVHGAGGTLLQHRKEHVLHCDIQPGDVVFYFTTTGWMMWNWLVSALASAATIVLYDGAPLHSDPGVLWRLAEREEIAVFGTSARYLAS